MAEGMSHHGAWQVLAPFDAEDSRGLLKAAIRDPDPVVFLENEILYGESFPVTDEILGHDFTVPIGKCKVHPEWVGTPFWVSGLQHAPATEWEGAQHLAML